jgi:hypothetical protein
VTSPAEDKFDKLVNATDDRPWYKRPAFWVCWISLMAILLVLLFSSFRHNGLLGQTSTGAAKPVQSPAVQPFPPTDVSAPAVASRQGHNQLDLMAVLCMVEPSQAPYTTLPYVQLASGEKIYATPDMLTDLVPGDTYTLTVGYAHDKWILTGWGTVHDKHYQCDVTQQPLLPKTYPTNPVALHDEEYLALLAGINT